MPNLYYLENARSEDQRKEMMRLEAAGICLFCPEVWDKPDGKKVLWTNGSWAIVENDFPYPHTDLHLLLVPREHVTALTELSTSSWLGMHDALKYAVETYGLDPYGIAARNGDMRYTGGTIAHLHLHLVVGDDSGEPVRVKLTSRPPETK